jgi:hypothetical protein
MPCCAGRRVRLLLLWWTTSPKISSIANTSAASLFSSKHRICVSFAIASIMPSWVYVITNPAMPGLVKVGFTDRDPKMRAQELTGTGLPLPYLVRHSVQVRDGRLVERAAHAALSSHHVGKEWFRCSVEVACSAVDSACAGSPHFVEGGLSNRSTESPLVPGHPLEPLFNFHRPTANLRRDAEPKGTKEDDGNPLPPGHPTRGLL